MGATRRSLQAQPKILKKLSEHKSTNQNENFPKKVCFAKYLKKEKEPNILMGATDGIRRLNPKCLKKLSEHQINQSE
jgi:hypothetical protein